MFNRGCWRLLEPVMSCRWEKGGSLAVRRLQQLSRVLHPSRITARRCNSAAEGEWLIVGDVKGKVETPRSPELVPRDYAHQPLPQSLLRHLRWMIQKDALGQDLFLIGPPGPQRRHLALAFCELLGREVEYVSLSRDTTETDLKQRREIVSGTVKHVDQSAVRAALKGRVLVLEGIEKAERNVLPVLNNLLENREMQLDDGRFIVAHERYDKLLQEHGKETLDNWSIVRASEKFRVIALGLPVPPYRGNPLDPPLRSRFQARSVLLAPFHEQLEEMKRLYPNVDEQILSSLFSITSTLHTLSQSAQGGPVDLTHHIHRIANIMEQVPSASPVQLLQTVYPADLLGTELMLQDAIKRFGLLDSSSHLSIDQCQPVSSSSTNTGLTGSFPDDIHVTIKRAPSSRSYGSGMFGQHSGEKSSFVVVGFGDRMQGIMRGKRAVEGSDFVPTAQHEDLLCQMLQSHLSGDFCLVGGRGSGKTTLVNTFAALLGYSMEPIVLYQDMTSRELLQQRTTLPNGDTSWRLSPLVTAAREGRLAVLDGVHRLDAGTLGVLKRLIQDRELSLLDGTRLLSQQRYTAAMTAAGLSEMEMGKCSVFPIHPKFRIIAIGEPQKSSSPSSSTVGAGSSLASWLSPELLSMFPYHHVRPLPPQQEKELVLTKVPSLSEDKLDPLLNLAHSLRTSADPTLQSLSPSLSTRQLLRMARRLASHQQENLYQAATKACLSRFLPPLARASLIGALSEADIQPPTKGALEQWETVKYERRDGHLRIGQTKIPIKPNHDAAALVPDVLFYDNQQHLRILEDMLKDFSLGEHLLLIGNQGVGKNKIVDRFLHLLNLPREYLQLHRDTTVQTLTLQPSVQDGVITYQDSPLVRALQLGRVLVIDEADKAPTHVTCILKNILEGGEITLADGRRIVRQAPPPTQVPPGGVIPIHPDFRMIVLANRPGFPFLGNDFFAALGDVFSCHAVDNPDLESEMSMLQQYGPEVPEAALKRLVLAFSELRQMADEGLIAYPYSTREVVSVVRHLQEFPHEGIGSVVRNVFDFDSFHPELLEVVVRVLHKHGIPTGGSPANVRLAPEHPLPPLTLAGKWRVAPTNLELQMEKLSLSIKGPYPIKIPAYPVERVEARGRGFSELKSHWIIPLHETNYIGAICTGPGQSESADYLHMATQNPISVFSMQVDSTSVHYTDFSDFYPPAHGLWRPQLSLVPLGGSHAGKVLLHEAESNSLFMLSPMDEEVFRVSTDSLARSMRDLLSWKQANPQSQSPFCMCAGVPGDGTAAVFQKGSNSLSCFDFSGATPAAYSLTLPVAMTTMHVMSPDQWLIRDNTDKLYLLHKSSPGKPVPDSLREIAVQDSASLAAMSGLSMDGLPAPLLGQSLGLTVDESTPQGYSRVVGVGGREGLGGVITGTPLKGGSTASIYTIRSDSPSSSDQDLLDGAQRGYPAFLPGEGEVVYPLQGSGKGEEPGIAVVDLPRHTLRKIVLPVADSTPSLRTSQGPTLFLSSLSDGCLVAVDSRGTVRVLETGYYSLQKSLSEWRSLVGNDSDHPLQMTYSRESGEDVTKPKHGKEDPDNAPHVGGNTWAGGTGGRDTAGLGGKGGPYRLDAGHDVHQIPDWEKESVPEEVKRAAWEMGQKAKRERLREIQMSEHDAEMYQKTRGKVHRQIQTLKVMLESLQSKSSERQWLRHQTSGDLDERKLIEGLTGERAIYKRRGEKVPEFGSEHLYPKSIRLVVDVSGSMYRFNGYDGRLQRTLEAVLMVMESFDRQRNFKLDIVGHSGDSDEVPFVKSTEPPTNDKERLQVLKAMIAESQFCWAGDHTVEATHTAVQKAAKEVADERFVIMLSDANFSRYGIKPEQFAALMSSDPNVNVFAIFIGSLGDQAKRLKEALPAGRTFICLDNRDLPQIMQQILSSTLI